MIDYHEPVMCSQVLNYLITKKNGIYLDCTLGGGGHSQKILEIIYPEGYLIGLDQDIDALEYARIKLKKYEDRLMIIKSNFKDLRLLLSEINFMQITGILFDLGLSSHQLDNRSRGFSFMGDHLLDMRMDLSSQFTAYDVINGYTEQELWDIFSRYGEERFSRSIAKIIVEERKKNPIKSTTQLADLVKRPYVKYKKNKWRIHPATKIFQALRIEVNDELKVLQQALQDSISILEPQGRICVLAYHSLEDRIAKHTFKDYSKKETINKNGYGLKILSKKPFYPTKDEIEKNQRARSAKMRVAEKIFLEEVSKNEKYHAD
ncbi:MAG: 16S rRNA (cytosine(1402)-N(4))-methyltransferase RsmH [Atribacterota bacterium]|nr:16S rRNA (cytosine(1402)-N(4))-methyltransferase RsmH [Atribacterota bacterium]MDD4363181.1 16S rRNA (cytosine(1402)-N(4))-methyltransferase RsmH [Atribacterota bacterium]